MRACSALRNRSTCVFHGSVVAEQWKSTVEQVRARNETFNFDNFVVIQVSTRKSFGKYERIVVRDASEMRADRDFPRLS